MMEGSRQRSPPQLFGSGFVSRSDIDVAMITEAFSPIPADGSSRLSAFAASVIYRRALRRRR